MFEISRVRKIACIVTVFSAMGCVQTCESKRLKMSPDKVVEEYLDTAFGMTDMGQKELLLSYTTGKLRNALKSATDEKFEEAFLKRKFKLESYSIVERTDISPNDVAIVFQLKYRNNFDKQEGADESPLVTTENTVRVVRKKQKVWFVEDVLSADTTIDFPLGSIVKGDTTDPYVEQKDENSEELEQAPEDSGSEDSKNEESPDQ